MRTIYDSEYRRLIELLKVQRYESDLTQQELAMILGVDQTFISKYEQCQRRLDVIELKEICEALGTSLIDFLTKFENRDSTKEQ